jgi:hypothetical protein
MDLLDQKKFSIWTSWKNKNNLSGINYPGIYVIAYTSTNLNGTKFSWHHEIIYIGMTNSKGGLRSRLHQLDRTLKGKINKHGGADRIKYIHSNYDAFCENAYVTILPVKCDPSKIEPQQLIKMSDVPKYEYLCWAEYIDRYGELPKFNQKSAPKYSKRK